ncbi:hypothetical protein D9611_012946 [Ephemerocybe angulata]|uniref:Uncharacterized protein n=1 Tax=Ephemerocybe angulata TaxID=980116 RepID=A0A8H5FF37_9AGAR|nr:hypothetical protein D9611_012946 [Tulosesus angulatus]
MSRALHHSAPLPVLPSCTPPPSSSPSSTTDGRTRSRVLDVVCGGLEVIEVVGYDEEKHG